MANSRFLGKKQLSDTNSLYSFCPYCVQDAKKQQKNYKEVLKPIFIYKVMETIKKEDGTYKNFVDEYYFCERCQRKLSVDLFRLFYTCRADGTKWNERANDGNSGIDAK